MAAAFPKISDNEMIYFQFKAKQLCELMKDDEAWSKHCSTVSHEDCSECSPKKPSPKNSKTVGIQVTAKKPPITLGKPSSQTISQKEEALDDLRARLENIELEMEKIYETSLQNAKKKMSEPGPSTIKVTDQKQYNFIQDSLKTSIAKIDSLFPGKLQKTVRPIKNVNSGYFLPHELQKKRAVSRKAYLASMEICNAKKQDIVQSYKKDVAGPQKNKAKRVFSKPVSKTSKKSTNKSKAEKSIMADVDTLLRLTADVEIKDENIELIVDGILEDLLREAVMDLNKIKLTGSIFQLLKTSDQQTELGGYKEKSSAENTVPKMPFNVDTAQLAQLKSLLNSPLKPMPKSEVQKEAFSNSTKEPFSPEKSKQTSEELLKTFTQMVQPQTTLNAHPSVKFVCGVLHIISVGPAKAKEISLQTEEFWKYLTRISRVVVGKFNPWAFCNAIADSIVDDCIDDVAEELCNVPSALIKFLYNQEFQQQVE